MYQEKHHYLSLYQQVMEIWLDVVILEGMILLLTVEVLI